MADDSSGEKTEEPTHKRLRDAREKGEVAKSAELAGSASFLACTLCVLALVSYSATRLAELQMGVDRMLEAPSRHALAALTIESLKVLALLSAAPVAAAAFVNFAALWLQVGGIFSVDPIKPKMDNLNPVKGLKKIFGMKSLVNFIIMTLKSVIIAFAVLLVMRQSLPDMIRVIHGDISSALGLVQSTMIHLLLWCGSAFLFLGVVDYGYQRWQFIRDKRMTKSEVKREYREEEGDPHQRAARKRMASGEDDPREHFPNIKRSSLALKDFDGRIVVLVYRPNRAPTPLTLLRAAGTLGVEAETLAIDAKVPVVVEHELVSRLFPIAETGVPLSEAMAQEVLPYLKSKP
jgi:flagellar biosynthesis protein FlhB